MILPLHDRVRDRVRAVLGELYGADVASAATIPIESPPNRTLGDLGSPAAFDLARRLRKAPRAIAQEIAAAVGAIVGVEKVEAAPNGYLNVFLDRRQFLLQRLGVLERPAGARVDVAKTIVEHTAINPNKAAHIGHLRNSALGDTLVRVLGYRGTPVEIQNYIDDTGVQVADVVVGFRDLEQFDLAGVQRVAETTRFDYYCWDLYARVTEWYTGDKERLKVRAATLHDIEHGRSPAADIAALVADRIVRCHLKTMGRLNIDYHLLTWEGDILRLAFWARAFEVLKQTGAVYLQDHGRLAGCWVMKIDDEPGMAAEGSDAGEAADDEGDEREKVIVRSNGTVTYVGKDMAYQFWKSGLLGRDFHYRRFAKRLDGDDLWATTSRDDEAAEPHPPFGAAAATYNVIDVRQSYLQKLLKQALIAVGHPLEAERLTHFSYEMVALSHATARELGFAPPEGSEEAKKPFVEVSGRKGLGVKADDLIDRVFTKARSEVDRRVDALPEEERLPDEERRRIAEQIGVAAVRYFMIKYSRTKVIAFDIDEAVSFVGESGPYLQYAVVRANRILRTLQERTGLSEADVLAVVKDTPIDVLRGADDGHELWNLVLEAARLDEVVEQVVRSLEFAVLAKYGFGLAQMFSAFYQDPKQSVVNESRSEAQRWRAAAVLYVRDQLTQVLNLMGVGVPQRM